MIVNVLKIELKEILPLRNLFLQETNFQIRYNACHERGWTDSYILTHEGTKIGYGSIKGNENLSDRDTLFEFYMVPTYRHLASTAFLALLELSGVNFIECQTNDLFLTSLLYQYGQDINSGPILFEDHVKTDISMGHIIFRRRKAGDIVFEHKSEPVGEYVLELNDEIVATGGFLLHYNFPFADLFMEVKEDDRRNGLGSLLIQELKTQCYLTGRVPAARCDIKNHASKATLIKAGFRIAGFMLLGRVK